MFKSSNIGSFKVKNNSLLLLRVGPANGIIQKHKSKPFDLRGNKITDPEKLESWNNSIRRPPERRGYFAFPYPFDDVFYYYHYYEKHLPKYFKNENIWDKDEEDFKTLEEYQIYDKKRDIFYEEKRNKINEIIKRNKQKKIWYKGHFYSHIQPKGYSNDKIWYRYDNVREWIESARKYIKCRISKDMWVPYDRGDMELFIPN